MFLFRARVARRNRLDATVKGAYRAPHPTWSSRTPILVLPREIPAGPEGAVSDLLGEIEAGLAALEDRPVAIAWAMRDIAFTPQVLEQLWPRTFPTANVTRLEDAGNLQDDAHQRIGQARHVTPTPGVRGLWSAPTLERAQCREHRPSDSA